MAKFELVFVLTQEKAFSLRLNFKANKHRFFQNRVLEIFKIALGLSDRHVFMQRSLEILNVSNTATLIQIF